MMREAQMVAPEGFVVASIQAPYQHFRPTEKGFRIGFGWLTEYKSEESVALHHDFALRIIKELADQEIVDAGQVFLYGFSQAAPSSIFGLLSPIRKRCAA